MIRLKGEDDTPVRLKGAAIELFSRHGIDGVSVRSILNAASVKNSAGLHYYFRTKDDLLRELVRDALERTRRARNTALDALEATGKPITVRDIVRLIVYVETIGTGDPEQREDVPIGFGHMRFISVMQLNHRDKFMQAVREEGDISFQRCLEHIALAVPSIPRRELNQKMIFFFQFAKASLSMREAAFVADPTGGKLWGSSDALDNMIEALVAIFLTKGRADVA